jgi:hypothetical protein
VTLLDEHEIANAASVGALHQIDDGGDYARDARAGEIAFVGKAIDEIDGRDRGAIWLAREFIQRDWF